MSRAEATGALSVDYAPVRSALADREATAFVHVGPSDDPILRYLARSSGLAGELAVCVTSEQALLFAPEDPDGAGEAFPGDRVVPGGADVPTGERVATALDDLGRAGTVLTPRTIPHDAALYVDGWGFEVASTDVVARARMAKTDAERLRVRTVQAAADAGVARAREVLGESEGHDGDHLEFEGRAVTTETLRRAVGSALAASGVHPGVVAVGAGAVATPRSDAAIRPGEPVVLSLAPQGRDGYHGHVVRTLVPDSDGGWTRRAQLAADGALEAAFAELEADVTVATVEREGTAELTAYGFDGPDGSFDAHGVGLERAEAPSADATEIPAGAVLALDATVTGPEGVVRLADLGVVTADGAERLGTAERSLVP